jgi:hypothetical protein
MTLNQKYKKSKSTLSFKDWIFEQQKKGNVDFEDEKFSADGERPKIEIAGVPVIYIGIGLVVILGAMYLIPKLKK